MHSVMKSRAVAEAQGAAPAPDTTRSTTPQAPCAAVPAARPGTAGPLAHFIDQWALLSRALCGRLAALLPQGGDGDESSHRALAIAVAESLPHLQRLHHDALAELNRHAFACHLLDEAQQARDRLRVELNHTRADVLKARQLAMHDALTALPNRRAFMDILAQMLANPGPRGLALMMLDLDGFKQVNDEHGHETGDRVLRIVAARLARTVRKLDVVGRMGGDEFTCLLRDAPPHEVLVAVAQKLGEAVAAPITLNGATLCVRASIGIATCQSRGAGADWLMAQADSAMYQAKRAHCGHVFAATRAVPDPARAPAPSQSDARVHRSHRAGGLRSSDPTGPTLP